MATHCTGWKATHAFARRFPDAFIQNSVGTTFELARAWAYLRLVESGRWVLVCSGSDLHREPGTAATRSQVVTRCSFRRTPVCQADTPG